MAYPHLFDKQGRFTDPGHEALAALDDAGRARVARVGDASRQLDAATSAIADNEKALAQTQAEITALDKIVPRQTHTDLVKQQIADTARRRAGL
jgi:phage-related tail protein